MHVQTVKERLELGLRCVEGLVAAAPAYVALHLEDLEDMCLPLMSSALVGACRLGGGVCVWGELCIVGQ